MNAKSSSLLGAVLALLVPLVVLITPYSASAAGPAPHYLMTAFTNASESNMYVYDSANATNFDLVKATAYVPPTGLIRDPSVIRHTDGNYYVTYTTNWTSNTIGLARSADAVNWTFLRNVTIPVAGITNAWAPEWFVDTDRTVHIVVSVSTTGTGGNFQPYRITATNSAFSSWSSPAALRGISPNYIDSFIVKIGSTYHDFTKNETTKYIEHATATSLTGPWTFTGTGNWAGWQRYNEGPALVQLPGGGWRAYFDEYGAGRYWYSDSYDGLRTWSARTQLPGLSGSVRHFTVLRENVGDAIVVPAGNRSFQASNYPGEYVRHRNNLGYLATIGSGSPLVDRQDGTFTVVAGLANGACLSLRSVNYPTSYLRRAGGRIVLQNSDGSVAFRGDATFCARTGLAGGGTVSLESYNRPGHYLRHRDQELWVDPRDASALFAADSSFAVSAPLV